MSAAKWQVLQWAGRLVKYAQLAALSSKFGYGYVSGPAEDQSLGDESTQQRVRFMQWFGFRSTPVVNHGECVVVAPRGGTSNAVAVAADNLSYGPTDLKEGEACMYAKEGQTLRMDTNGDIVLNGGTKTVAREGDEADGGALSVAMGMSGVASVLYWEPGSLVATTVATFPAKTPIKVKLGPGAPKVKA